VELRCRSAEAARQAGGLGSLDVCAIADCDDELGPGGLAAGVLI
jgi:hypothetical protein